jgi:hypothetical protein
MKKTLSDSGDHPQRNPNQDSDPHGHGDELKSRWKAPHELFGDRFPRPPRGSKVSPEHIAQVDEVLVPNRPVEMKLFFHGCDLLMGCKRSYDQKCGIAGQLPGNRECDDGHADEDGDELEYPSCDVEEELQLSSDLKRPGEGSPGR